MTIHPKNLCPARLTSRNSLISLSIPIWLKTVFMEVVCNIVYLVVNLRTTVYCYCYDIAYLVYNILVQYFTRPQPELYITSIY